MKKRKRQRRIWLRGLSALLLATVAVTLLITLPFRWLPPPTTSFILQARYSGLGGAPACTSTPRQWVDQDSIAPVMALAVVASEDQRFPVHRGLDFKAIMTALKERNRTGRVRGASTITQQLVKNLYLWPGQSLWRKAIEAWLALVVEATWPKERIMEVYLNVVQFADCTFGVQAASQQFFRKPAARLTATEAARLAAVLPNPVSYRPDQRSDYMQEKTRWILKQMKLLGGISYLRYSG